MLNSKKLRLRREYARLLFRARLAPAFWRSLPLPLTILNYHQFVPRISSSFLQVTHASLVNQLHVLREAFDFVPLSDLLDSTHSFKISKSYQKPTISITIDDGDRSLLDVLSVFEDFETPITVFLPIGLIIGKAYDHGYRSILLRYTCLTPRSSLIPELSIDRDSAFSRIISASTDRLRAWVSLVEEDSSSNYNWPNELLSIDDVLTLVKHPLVTVCSHSMSHLPFNILPRFLAEWEIEKSVGWIRCIGGDAAMFAYPYGAPRSYNRLTNTILEKSGVKIAFSSTSFPTSTASSPFVIGRSFVFDSSNADFIRGLGYGAFEIWDRMRYCHYLPNRPWDTGL